MRTGVRAMAQAGWGVISTGCRALVAVVLPFTAAAQVGLGLAPMRLEIEAVRGRVYSGPLTLSNEGDSPVRVRAELLDFFIDGSGTPQFARPAAGESRYSCRQWLLLNPMEAEVPAGKSVVVRYTLRVPAEADRQSFHCAAGFTTMAIPTRSDTTGLNTAIRMVTTFYAMIDHPGIEAELSGMSVERVPGNGEARWQAVVLVKNWGSRYFRPTGKLDVVDDADALIESSTFPSLPVLPNREQRFVFPLKTANGAQGYRLRARVDLGTAEIQEAILKVAQPTQHP